MPLRAATTIPTMKHEVIIQAPGAHEDTSAVSSLWRSSIRWHQSEEWIKEIGEENFELVEVDEGTRSNEVAQVPEIVLTGG